MTSPTPDPDPNVWKSPFEDILEQGNTSDAHNLGAGAVRLNPNFGTPSNDSAFWEGQQQLPDDCAIKCQQFILEQFTGTAVSEATLVREALEQGWYAPGEGTTINNVGNLLELHGVAVTHYEHADQFHLAMELAQGHKVIVGVASETLWHQDPLLDALRGLLGIDAPADHAVVVSGIDTSDPRHVLVQISDPGTGQALATYPMEQFLEAWRGSDFFMVATQAPAPDHLPEMAHFDYAVGHIAQVAGMSYDRFLEYADRPDTYGDAIHHLVNFQHDPDGTHSLHQPATHEHRGDHVGHLAAADAHQSLLTDPQHRHDDALLSPVDAAEINDARLTDTDHQDAGLGALDAADRSLDDSWNRDWN